MADLLSEQTPKTYVLLMDSGALLSHIQTVRKRRRDRASRQVARNTKSQKKVTKKALEDVSVEQLKALVKMAELKKKSEEVSPS